MVVAIKGILVQCDPPTMEIILQLNETKNFIIEKISEEHVLCSEAVCGFLEEEVTRRLELAERPLAEMQKEKKANEAGAAANTY
ncbi:REX1 DNA repair domain-containing protein, putative [Eimeria necatrix]|uniref:General transcription and DNA repair factor IIH subunit TFB5 n=1 Tax=Eimeria necatrix TaxID=51315 RepID=U6MJ83_9EIME|nr:REX1 DNA repair domain-containing protein, putative [Eimeria necatrix]CDJ64071.1 REX1 DNA repair domain-containing protein, putative [Eimeria necatrix]